MVSCWEGVKKNVKGLLEVRVESCWCRGPPLRTSAGMQDKRIDYQTTPWPFCSSGIKGMSVKVQVQGDVLSPYHTFDLSPPMFPDKAVQREATEHR